MATISAAEPSAPPNGTFATVIDQLTTSWTVNPGDPAENDARNRTRTELTYAILSTSPPSGNASESTGFRAMTTSMIDRVREAFEMWDDLIAISLVETNSVTVVVSEAGDTVFELAGQGTDTVRAAVSYVLAAGQSIETLRTTIDAGTAAIDLAGNDLANKIVGNGGINLIIGGDGADMLYGGGGADTFVYGVLDDSTVIRTGRDTLADFSLTDGDRIDLHLIDTVAGGVVNQAFRFLGDDAFGGRAGQLRAVFSGADTLLQRRCGRRCRGRFRRAPERAHHPPDRRLRPVG
ncbi:calcium-binding protein [Methylobacterium marchantiae]|uniref:Calcium-binding protein n=1 Tax=Methylobacterium marchantiae TaxID=600331 RepID=A0ABW3WWY1_9HYPH